MKLAVILGSSREGRRAAVIGDWLAGQVRPRPGIDLTVLDCVTEPEELRAAVHDADAYVIVVPEYNHSYPGPLKAFIDSFYKEWQAKPVGFVSYGGVSGGLRAVEHLRQVFAELHAVTVRDTVSFHNVWSHFDADGAFPVAPDAPAEAARIMIDQLGWWALALKEAKAVRPYGG
ncbi:NAD(P)H-dependent oxidoreductase [Actinocorallia longicatena]|uniref:NAD(P)H-dependent oxidoreductase n=1 Tax=Actinocorallia longicatena TaxID=111803 RepID=A0ABP6QKW4_9ACTN